MVTWSAPAARTSAFTFAGMRMPPTTVSTAQAARKSSAIMAERSQVKGMFRLVNQSRLGGSGA